MRRRLAAVSVSVILASCAGAYRPQYHINEIVIVNNSRQIVTDVVVRSSSSGRMFACGNVAPLGICADRFPRRNLSEGPVEVEWALGGVRSSTTLPAEVPSVFVTGLPLRGVLEIDTRGGIEGRFEQESPLR